jgi:acyl transferase domain-containing protein/acyl carrier protein
MTEFCSSSSRSSLDGREPYFRAHKIAGNSIVLGMYALSLAMDDVRKTQGQSACSFRGVKWLSPVRAEDTQGQLTVDVDSTGVLSVDMRWSDAVDRGALVVSAQVERVALQRPPPLAAEHVRRLLDWTVDGGFYELVERYGITHEPMLQVVDRYVVGANEVLFSAFADDLVAERAMSLSPALLNGAFAAVLALQPFEPGKLVLPLSIGRLEVFGPLRGRCVGRLQVLRRSDRTFAVDVTLYGGDAKAAVVMHDLTATVLDAASQLQGASSNPSDVVGATKRASSGGATPNPEGADLHAQLTALISDLLGKDMSEAPPQATFMELGLSSAELLRLATDMARRLGVELYPTFFFEYQTLAAAGAYLRDRGLVFKSLSIDEGALLADGLLDPDLPEVRVLPGDEVRPSSTDDAQSTDIAIIGVGCRFAGANDPDEFWMHIAEGHDMVGEVPPSRWDVDAWFDAQAGAQNKSYCRAGSFIDGVDQFDASFFSVSPNEARAMDPQLRLLLEVLYHTTQDAGYARRIRGSKTGLYVGACFQEYFDEMVRGRVPTGAYDLNASASSFISNRASYCFDLRGPSLTVDVACSSSLVALHLASKALRAGEADMALVAGVNLLLSPLHYLQFSAIGALSPTGRCHSFDSRADGYVPGEGIAAVLLKPLGAALRDGDRVVAVIKGSAVNHCGRSNSPTAPSISQQSELLTAAWADAGIDPATLDYIEAHGTGTKLGDPIEIAGIARAFQRGGARQGPCLVGSIKSNIGHTEGAAGLAGVLKVVQMLRHEQIPAMANFRERNPLLPLDRSGLAINAEAVAWLRRSGHARRAAVSSFGLGGGYAHVVLEESPALREPPSRVADLSEGGVEEMLFPLSANSAASLREQAASLGRVAAATHGGDALRSLAAVLQHRADELSLRVVFAAADAANLRATIERLLMEGIPLHGLHSSGTTHRASGASAVARAWLEGAEVEWPTKSPRMCDVHLNVPLYPFDRQSYWFASQGTRPNSPPVNEPQVELQARSAAWLQPLLASPQVGQLQFDVQEFSGKHPFLDQHRICGRRIVPGVVHMELFVQAAFRAGGQLPVRVTDLYWLTPLAGESVRCELHWQRAGDERAAILRHAGTDAATAQLDVTCSVVRPPPVDIAGVIAGAPRVRTGDQVYAEVQALGLELGPYFRTIETVQGNERECLIRLYEDVERAQGFLLAPALLDGINHGLRGIAVDEKHRIGLAIPYHIASVACFEDTSSARYLYASLTDAPMCYDLQVLAGDGAVLAVLTGFQLREYRESATTLGVAPSPRITETHSRPADIGDLVTRQLEELMGEVTGLDSVRLREGRDLTQQGVDSVAVAQFTRKLNRHYGLNLAPAVFFEHKTLASYARFLRAAHSDKVGAVLPQEGRPAPLIRGSSPAKAVDESGEAIAIVGIAGRFPQCDDVDELWDRLITGADLVSEIPKDRFDWREFADASDGGARLATHRGGFMRDVASFAAGKFGISRREAELMDPQQRMLLETVWESLLDGGYTRDEVAGSAVGVFVGAVNNEYYELLNESGVGIEAHSSTGMARSILANRVSHAFDFSGPSEVVDTACSSSLVAIHRAAQAIRCGECESAVAAGVNLLLTPKLFLSFSEAGMLSPDGRCKTFDAAANGYVRAEGCAALLMKPLAKALEEGDFIYGVLRGSGINHGGRVNSLTVPNPGAQADLLERVFRQAGVGPRDISYIEAHGTGTPMGDPIEINGIKRAFERLSDSDIAVIEKPWCAVGSIKSNMGHLEGAAGIAGVFKVLLSLHHRTIPQTLHVSELNPQIDLRGSPLFIATRPAFWAVEDGQRVAGVSSFGFGGANAHVVLGDHARTRAKSDAAQAPRLIIMSADSAEALRAYAHRMLHFLSSPTSRYAATNYALEDIACTLQEGREQLPARWGAIVTGVDEFRARLSAWLGDSTDRGEQTHASQRAGDVAEMQYMRWQEAGNNEALLACWLDGAVVPWRELRQRARPGVIGRRVPLPPPSWVRQRYWVPTTPTLAASPRLSKGRELVHPLFD